jgi:parallel beta-helix repeat protein
VISGLAAGPYSITVTSANGSTATAAATVQYLPVTNTTDNPDTYYATIQAAINAADPTEIIEVCAGTYVENITVSKSVTLNGPNAAISPNSGARVPEAIIVPSSSNAAAGVVVSITAADASVNGFTIDGDNTSLPASGIGVGGSMDAFRGIYALKNGLVNVQAKKNIVKNLNGSGIRFESVTNFFATTAGVVYSYNNTIDDNKVDNITSLGVDLRNSVYTKITNNTISNVRYGIFFSSFRVADQGLAANRVVSGNTIQTTQFGIWPNLYSATPYQVLTNTISAVADPARTKWYGITMATVSGAQNFTSQLNLPLVATPESWTFTDNNIDGAGVAPGTTSFGYWLWSLDNFRDNSNIDHYTTFTGGTIENVDVGIFMHNVDNDPVTLFGQGRTGAHASISNLNIDVNANGRGIYLKDDPTWTTASIAPLVAKRNVNLTIGSGVTITNGGKGLTIEHPFAAVTGANLGNLAFAGQTDEFIELVANTANLDATTATFDGQTGTSASLSQNFAIEDKVQHSLDNTGLGLVTWKANNDFVTTSTLGVQRGVDVASSGWTVNVADGTYLEDVNVNKTNLLLDGQSRSGTLIKGLYAAGGGATLKFANTSADGSTAKDLTITRDYQDWYNSTKNYGVLLSGSVSDITLDNVLVTGNRNGVYVENNGELNMVNSIVEENRTGLHITNTVRGSLMNNTLRNNQTHGIFYNLDDGTSNLTGFTMADNSIYGNWYSQATFRGANMLGMPADFECNWWGTDAPTVNATDPGELGYASLVPQQLSGTSAQATYNGTFRGNGAIYIDYTSWRTGETGNVSDPFLPTGMCNGTPVVIVAATPTSSTFCSANGSIDVDFMGGTAPYTISWNGAASGGPVAATSVHTIPMLPTGMYVVTVTDANGSTATASVNLSNLPVRNNTGPTYYSTIQLAIDAATAGDVIDVCAGTYTENITISKALTINGPNVGVAGTGMRVAEAVLLNSTIDISNAGNTTLDGLHIKRTDGATGPTNQLELDGGGTSTVQNCIFERLGSNTGQEIRAIATTTAGGPKVILNNKITGDISGGLFGGHKSWARGIYVDAGAFTVNFTGNTIENCRTAMNVDDYNNNLTIAGNTFNNNGTQLSLGGATVPSGSFVMGANDFINNAASTMVNLSNVAESFRLDMTSSSLNGTPFSLLGNTALFEVEARMAHKEVTASKKGKVIYKANNQYVNNFTVPVTKVDKIQNSIKYGDANDIINLEDGTYNEKLTVDKPNLTLQGVTNDKTLYIINGTGVADNGTGAGAKSGIKLNSGIINITIKDLTVQNHTGASGNADAGIYGILGNNNLTIDNVALLNNSNASGFYANGPIDNVDITNSMVSNNGTGARGIVIWNGLKTNITITGNMVTNNSCCGIELQDGDASSVNVSNNTIDIGSGDNAIGLVGLNPTIGANTVNNNTITGGGRFGIEVKNPAGGVTVDGNSVTLTTVNGDLRDRAGIAVFRRSVSGSNIDVPNGVTITGNTVTGYTQTLPEEGFGIVIEGTNHVVTGNTVNNCDIGIQEQGGAHPNANYPAGDGDQNVNMSANYFGRGNAPFACGNTISGNTLSLNGTNTRTVVMNSYGLVTNTTSGEYFCNIQAAVSDAQTLAGQTLEVTPATYNEQVLVTKGVTIKGVGMAKPTVDFTGTVSGKPTLFDVSVDGVTIDNIRFNVDLSKLRSAVIASGAGIDNITVKDNVVDAYGTPAGTYGDRNAVSINYGGPSNYRVATGGVNSVIFTNNTVNGTLPSSFFRSGIALDEGGATITGNTLQTINHDVLVRFAGNGAVTVSNNNLNGGGAEFADQNAGSSISLTNNTFTGAGAPGTAMLRVKNNYNGVAHNISNNTFNNFEWAVSLENMNSVTLDGNTFSATSGTARAVVVNTKSISSNSNTIVQVPIGATLTNNNFNGNGTALTFQNHDSDNDSYGTFTLGGVGNENDFASTLTNFIVFDGQTGSSNGSTFPVYPNTGGWPTTMACWDTDLTAENNLFDVGGGLELPASMDATDRNVLETKLTHDPDNICLGRIRYFYPVHNFTQNTYHALIQDAIDAPTTVNGDEIRVPAGIYAENLVIDKELTINGPNASVDPCSVAPRNPEAILTSAISDIDFAAIVYINPNTSNVSIKGFTIDGDNTALTSTYLGTNGADIDAAEGISTYETGVNNLTVSNNIIQNLSYFGVTLYDYPAAVPSSGHVISNNLIRNLGTYDAGSGIDRWGGGVLLYNNQYAAITDNCMTNVRLGIQTGNFHLANPGAPASQVISGNSIQARRLGVFHNLHYSNASPITFSNNTITGLNNANEPSGVIGIELASLSVGSTTQGNNIDLTGIATNSTGIEVWNVKNTAPAAISGGSLMGVNTGLFLNNYEGYNSDAADGAHASVTNLTITPNASGTGIRVLDSPSSTTHAAVSLDINAGVAVNGGATGLSVENGSASISGGSLDNLALNTTSGNYVQLLSNAGNLDGTTVAFDGTIGSGMTLPQLFATEDKIWHKIDGKALGFVTVKATNSYVTDIATAAATNNDYTRIRNAVELSANNWTVNLKGTFDWTEANAAASWALGNDDVASTGDDYGILVPANLNGVTFTAPEGLGTATIEGPGDLPTANLEGVLYFDATGDNQGWTMSNIVYDDFDMPIGMFFGAGGTDAYNNTTITNNTFNIATDLNVVDAPADPNQNIGIHYAFGTNQTISNNTFNVPGNGVSNGTNFSTTAVMQSNTSGGAVYDGLQITGNTINILNAQSASPEVILGIWDNGHAHTSNITISNNQFLNLAGGNNPALNLQRAFRVTSHSGASSTVTYSGNTAKGANIGFQWLAGQNFGSNMPIAMTGNTLNGNGIGMLVQSNGKAALSNNDFDDATDNTRDVQVQLGSVVTSTGGNSFAGDTYYVENLSATSINIETDNFDEMDNFRRSDKLYDALDANTSGLVVFEANKHYVSEPGTGAADETIANAIAAAASAGDEVHIEDGSYPTGLDATGKDIAFLPASTVVGCVTLGSNLVLNAGDQLSLEINGAATACTDHDQLVVNGTVTLGSATLVVDLGMYMPASGDEIVIISNDGGDAVVGQFAQGPTINVGGNIFSINYAGGDGNDVVLKSCGGGDVENLATTEKFCSIQAAIDDADTDNGHTITVGSGTYTENLTINKEVNLQGANFGTPGCGVRLTESTIAGGIGTAVTIAASNVTIKGFEITGATGVSMTSVNNVNVSNNKLNVGAGGIVANAIPTTAGNTLTIEDNCIDVSAQIVSGNPTGGVYINGAMGTDAIIMEGNTVTDGFYGYVLNGVNTTAPTEVKDGTITGVLQGVAVVNTVGGPLAAANVSITDMTMSGFAGTSPNPANNFHAGVYTFTAAPTTPANGITLTVNNCDIDGTKANGPAGAAIYLGDFSTGGTAVQNVTIDGGMITNNVNRGVDARGYVNASVSNVIFTNNGAAAWGSGGNDGFTIIAQSGATVTASGNTITHPAMSTTPVTALLTGNTPASTINATNNNILANGNPQGRGAVNGAGNTLNATLNWWGNANGPSGSGPGSGASVGADVTYCPWLGGSAPGGLPVNLSATIAVSETSGTTPNDGTICDGASVLLSTPTYVGIPTYLWSPSSETTDDVTVSPTMTTTYAVTVTFGTCVATDEQEVIVNPLPNTTITTETEVCSGATGIIASVPSAGMGAAYVWNLTNGTITAGQGSNSITFTAGASGTVIVSVGIANANDCFASNPGVPVTINPLPTGVLTAVSPVCYGATPQLTFTASAGTGPFDLVINGVSYNGITSGVAFPASAAITSNTVYDLTSVTDFKTCNTTAAPVSTITVNLETTPPTWVTVANALDATVQCNDAVALAAAQALAPTATDNCTMSLTPVKTAGAFVAGMTCSQAGTYTNTWTVMDEAGNSVVAVYTQTITVIDDTKPTWVTAANALDATVQCSDAAALAAAQALVPTAIDNCDVSLTPVKTAGAFVAGMTCPQAGTYTNTWTVMDDCGNEVLAVYTQVITVIDDTKPTWVTAANALDATVQCSDAAGLAAAQALVPNAMDNCDMSLTPVKTAGAFVAGMTCPQAGTYTNTWTVKDDCNNEVLAVYTQVITVIDNTKPTWVTAANALDATVQCSDAAGLAAAQALAPTATDNCDVSLTPVKTAGAFVPGMTCPQAGIYTNTWTVSDDCGNVVLAVYTQTITVIDNTAPTVLSTDFPGDPEDSPDVDNFTCGDVVNRNADPGGCIVPLTITKPTWLDNCDAVVTRTQVTNNGTALSNFPGIPGYVSGNFPGGMTIVTFRGTDDCGNMGTCSITINVTDNQPPQVVGCTPNQTAVTSAGQCTATVTMPAPLFTDNCAIATVTHTATGATSFSGSGLLSSGVFNAGVTTVLYTVTDVSSNTNTSCSFTVTVTDNQAPTITCPAPVTVDANNVGCTATAVSLGTPMVMDNCTPNVTNDAPMTYPLGATNVVWTATDVNGPGTASCTQVVTVVDGGITLNLSNLFIEGYMISATEMRPVHLNAVNAGGTVPGNPSPTATQCDYITVELRSDMAPYAVVYSQEVILSTTGTATVNFPTCAAIGTDYYIVIKGRNIVETWSASPQSAAYAYSYNFDNSADAFGSNMNTVFGVPAIYSGDMDDVNMNGLGDGVVDNADFDAWLIDSEAFTEGYIRTDLSGDAVTDNIDFAIWLTNSINFVEVLKP